MDPDPYSVEPPSPPPPTTPSPAKAGPDLAREDVLCIQCSYNLRGLSPDGRCPECGTSVQRSVQGNLLVFSSDDYLGALHRGVTLILTAIAIRVLLTVAAAIGVSGVALSGGSDAIQQIAIVLKLVDLCLAGLLIWGWWLFSAPDPAVLGTDTGVTARRVIRATVIVAAVFACLEAASSMLEGSGASTMTTGLAAVAAGAAVLAFVAFVVKFFAAMLYLRWIAPRLPDPRVDARAKLLMWLGPTLCVTGPFCLMIPWLVALVLYWNLLNWVRLDIKAVRESSTRGAMA